ncbi:MAG: nuclear transport factor 2 family protein [Actinomycetota bacterium]|nr:nuclear transport factor 2 family protein [Actinomycetota bacterium]
MTDIAAAVNDYIATWNERDAQRRRELVTQTFADDASYLDAHRAGECHDGIEAMIAQAQDRFPGHRIDLVFGPDAHNDRVRFSWSRVGPDGPVGGGTDFATIEPDGRLSAVTGFSDAPA